MNHFHCVGNLFLEDKESKAGIGGFYLHGVLQSTLTFSNYKWQSLCYFWWNNFNFVFEKFAVNRRNLSDKLKMSMQEGEGVHNKTVFQ